MHILHILEWVKTTHAAVILICFSWNFAYPMKITKERKGALSGPSCPNFLYSVFYYYSVTHSKLSIVQ
jgi:hypothetical protein